MVHSWSLSKIWEEAFIVEEKPYTPRNYLYASEIGYSMVDNFHKMKGTPPSNKFTMAARKKMEAGKIFEMVCLYVLKRCGILKSAQLKVDFELPGCVEVHGKLDALAGGEIDLQQAEMFNETLNLLFTELDMPVLYIDIADKMLANLKEMAAGASTIELEKYIYEIKSVSQFVWDLIERQNKAMITHRMQNFHYCYGLTLFGRVSYINREDVRQREFIIAPNGEEFGLYKNYVEEMTYHYRSGKCPPLEPEITYNADALKFNKNTTGVEWSKYLTLLYGYPSQTAFREKINPIVKDLNYVFKRCLDGANLTAGNLTAIREAKTRYPNWADMVDLGKLRKTIIAEQTMPVDVEE